MASRRSSANAELAGPPGAGSEPGTPRWRPFGGLRRQLLAGLLLVLPFVITAWIVYWLYSFVDRFVIAPAAGLVIRLVERRYDAAPPAWFVDYAAPPIGILAVLVLLYGLGFFARARVDRLLDAVLLRVPVITSIHRAVSRVFSTLRGTAGPSRFQRAVLVEFPHPGMKVPAFVTASCRDEVSGQTILCVYVPTTPVPTSGYVLLVPEEEVIPLDWSLEQTIQAVVSFGMTAPDRIRYFRSPTADRGHGG